ncbi:MAG: family 78 glycoside hydrolase catalytic domain, partial [Oscillospiraceae bacterium]|nr:family 78 glycoside hydrolase catalytic domain [Oscillospiraceae bacterium]
MKFTHLRTNHLTNPLGHTLNPLTLSWTVESTGKKQTSARVEIALDEAFSSCVFDSGEADLSSLGYTPDLTLSPRTRYWWRVTVTADDGDRATSDPAFFETAKLEEPWQAGWITSSFDKDRQFLLKRSFDGSGVVSARAYVCGLGSYELWLNGKKVGDEVLAPGFHSYDFWLQYQTYDLTDLLQPGENTVGALLAPAWYKGRFGFNGEEGDRYGDTMKFIAELHLQMADGSEQVICTDDSWLCAPSFVTFSNIYDGEKQDARLLEQLEWTPARPCEAEKSPLTARYSPRILITETLKPEKVLHTPAGETVLDFGQNMTGWVEFDCDLPAGTKVHLGFGELLQENNFYRDNLRSAKAEFEYISAGKPDHVRPYGTFFGFRYVKVEGMEADPAAFTACVIHSEMDRTGWIETADLRLNRLHLNALWGQRSNFLDVPTDCPQRDERMGWTGDAQIFAGTACFNMDAAAFYSKFMEDLRHEQQPLDGGVPYVIPVIKDLKAGKALLGHSSCAWGDVACVLPWQLYQHYGDKELLRRHYPAMKGWVHYIRTQDEKDGGKRLWQT